MIVFIHACCLLYFVSSLVAVGKKRSRNKLQFEARHGQKRHPHLMICNCVFDMHKLDQSMPPGKRQSSTDGSEEDINNDKVDAKDMIIAEKNYNRGSMAGHANKSAFYGRAVRLACGSKTSFKAVQELAESSVRDSRWQHQDPNKGSMMLA